ARGERRAVVEPRGLGGVVEEGVRGVVYDSGEFLVHRHARHVAAQRLARGGPGRALVQAVVRARGNAGPATVVERDAEVQLVRREAAGDAVRAASVEIVLDHRIDRVLFRTRRDDA